MPIPPQPGAKPARQATAKPTAPQHLPAQATHKTAPALEKSVPSKPVPDKAAAAQSSRLATPASMRATPPQAAPHAGQTGAATAGPAQPAPKAPVDGPGRPGAKAGAAVAPPGAKGPGAAPPKKGPTDEHHDWIHEFFGRDMRTLALDRTIKAGVRYATKARVLDGQNRNPFDTVNLFPINPDYKPARATSHTELGKAAMAARKDSLPLLSLKQAKGRVPELQGTLQSQEAALAQAEAGSHAAGRMQWEVDQTRKHLGHAQRLVASGSGSHETFEGFRSNGKDGGEGSLGLVAGTAIVGNTRKVMQGTMTPRQAVNDTGVRAAVGWGSGSLGTGIGTELGAAVGTRIAIRGAHVAQDAEKGAMLGSKFGGRFGSLAGGVVAGGVSLGASVLTGYFGERKGADGKSLIDHATDKIGHFEDQVLGPDHGRNRAPNTLAKAAADATDRLSPGVQNTASMVGAQAGSAGGGRAALSVRASRKAVSRANADVTTAGTRLERAANEKALASRNLAAAREAQSGAAPGAAAGEQAQTLASAEQRAVMAHAAREAEHEAAQTALATAKQGLKATGTGPLGRGVLAAKAVVQWNPAKAGVQREMIEAAETLGGKTLTWGGAVSGAGKLVSHAGFLGAAVSGVTQGITDYGKVRRGKMSRAKAVTDVGVQMVNGGVSGLVGAAAGAFAGAETGALVGLAGGPLGFAAGALGGAVVGMAVSLGAGVVLDKAEHYGWAMAKGAWGAFRTPQPAGPLTTPATPPTTQ